MMDAPFTPEQRAQRSRKGAYASWARTADPSARTAPARRALRRKFEQQVDPDGALPETERVRRADAAMKAYFTGLALRSSRARSKATAARKTAKELGSEARDVAAELRAEADRLEGGAA